MHPRLRRAFIASTASCILIAIFGPASARMTAGVGDVGNAALEPVASDAAAPDEAGTAFAKAAKNVQVEDLDRLLWPVPDTTINTPFTGEHSGIDIEGETGDPIVAAASGVVEFAGDDGDGYGLKVLIRHDKEISTLYSHLTDFTVSDGDRVERGDEVGTVGCTGSCSGDHLHFEVLLDGTPTDPTEYVEG